MRTLNSLVLNGAVGSNKSANSFYFKIPVIRDTLPTGAIVEKKHTQPSHEWTNESQTWRLTSPSYEELQHAANPVVFLGSLYQVIDWDIPLNKPTEKYIENEGFFMITKIKIVHSPKSLNHTCICIRAFYNETEVEFSVSALLWKRYIKKVA